MNCFQLLLFLWLKKIIPVFANIILLLPMRQVKARHGAQTKKETS